MISLKTKSGKTIRAKCYDLKQTVLPYQFAIHRPVESLYSKTVWCVSERASGRLAYISDGARAEVEEEFVHLLTHNKELFEKAINAAYKEADVEMQKSLF